MQTMIWHPKPPFCPDHRPAESPSVCEMPHIRVRKSLFQGTIWALSECNMAYFRVRNGPFRKTMKFRMKCLII